MPEVLIGLGTKFYVAQVSALKVFDSFGFILTFHHIIGFFFIRVVVPTDCYRQHLS